MTCATCGTAFAPQRKNHRFCSATCRLASFHQRREAARRNRDATIRLLLKPLVETVQDETDKRRITEALTLLEPDTTP